MSGAPGDNRAMGGGILLLTLLLAAGPQEDKPVCSRSTRTSAWPSDWRAAKECQAVEVCTCGLYRCGWKTVSIPLWVLAKRPRPAACGVSLILEQARQDRPPGKAPHELLFKLPQL